MGSQVSLAQAVLLRNGCPARHGAYCLLLRSLRYQCRRFPHFVCSAQGYSVSQPTNLKDIVSNARHPAAHLTSTNRASAVVLQRLEDWSKSSHLMAGCEITKAPLQVAVLLSGGVDSSLALNLAKAAGHEVTAFYLQIWFQEDFRNFWDSCPWEDDLKYCQQVCDAAGVKLEVVPLTSQYWDRVVAHSVSEIKAGRTPNPDILCNSRVKFGAFYEYLEEHYGDAFDRVVSGHYARLLRSDDAQAMRHVSHGGRMASSEGSGVRLMLTPDAIKDQTYFLAHLTQEQLSRAMFPLGLLTKAEVRALAAAAQLPNMDRKDSQGICFLGKVKFSEFIREHLGEWPGLILEHESNTLLGYHKGIWYHTVGQRRGIPLHGGPWYVTRKDVDTNTLHVSNKYREMDNTRNKFVCGKFNWINGNAARFVDRLSSATDMVPDSYAIYAQGEKLPDYTTAHTEDGLLVKVRHGPSTYKCQFTFCDGDFGRGKVVIDGVDQGLAPGQYAVFYHKEECLGSAVILES